MRSTSVDLGAHRLDEVVIAAPVGVASRLGELAAPFRMIDVGGLAGAIDRRHARAQSPIHVRLDVGDAGRAGEGIGVGIDLRSRVGAGGGTERECEEQGEGREKAHGDFSRQSGEPFDCKAETSTHIGVTLRTGSRPGCDGDLFTWWGRSPEVGD